MQQPSTALALEYTSEKYSPASFISFTEEEQNQINLINDSLKGYVEEHLHKYLLCDEPIETWDTFTAEIEKLGVNDLLAIYETAYNRIK